MRTLLLLLFFIFYCNSVFADSYYFQNCKLTKDISGNYVINLKKNEVHTILKKIDAPTQERTLKIKSITKDQIITKKTQIEGYEKFFIQYYLDASSNSVTSQRYEKVNGTYKLKYKSRSFCRKTKTNWKIIKEDKTNTSNKKKKSLKIKSSFPKCKGKDFKNWTNCLGAISAFEYKYIGEWKNGKTHGKGYEEWEDGRTYIGQFKNDKRHGQGTAKLPDGSIYVGEWKNGEKHGEGKQTFSSGEIHLGQFVNGAIVKGVAKYPDGSKYEGEFEFGKPKKKNEDQIEIKKGYRILVSSKKVTRTGWVKEKNRLPVEEKLKRYFNKEASRICSSTGQFKILKQKIEILELREISKFLSDEKSNVYRLGIDGEVACKE